jgi:hypothetical protein
MAQVTNTSAADVGLVVRGAASQTGSLFLLQNSASTSLSRFTSTGSLIFEAAASSSAIVTMNGSVTGATTAWGMLMQPTFATDVTVAAEGYRTALSTAASATVTTLRSFRAGNMTLGSGSAVTDQIGFAVSSLTGATNNYGFYGDVAAATGRWNLYMNGTAANHLAGNLCVGTTAIATSADKAIHMGNGTAPSANIASGGILYVESGALKYRGSSGTITTLGAA